MACVILAAGCARSSDPRDDRDFERMRRQMRYESYGSSKHFANGASMQAPPLHTVSLESARDAGDSLPSDSAIAIGRRQYGISCAPCHGDAGFGGGPIAPNLVEMRAASLRSSAVSNQSPRSLFDLVTDGKGHMPPLGWQLAPRERWAVVVYVRTLASSPTHDSAARADSVLADYLHQLDSLHAAHAPVRTILRLARPSSAR